jgi:hypothetical protein
MMTRVTVAAGLLLGIPVAMSGQSRAKSDTIQGSVLTDSAAAIAGATVNVTRAPDRSFLTATTDSLGRFKIIFPDGTGDYLVHAAMTGYKSERQRVLRAADGSMPPVAIKLTSAIQKLATVKVESSRPIPDRPSLMSSETGESSRLADGVTGIVSPDLAGNLDATALTIPGITQAAGGISAMGMGPSANTATLNGLAFSGSALPRDARTVTRIATSTYDPARGGFAGIETSVELEQGNLFSQRSAHVTLDDPSLQYGGVAGAGPDQRFRNIQLSAGGNGTVGDDKYPYNFGLQGGVREADVSPVETASDFDLGNAGLTRAAASSLLSALASTGSPLRPGRSALAGTSENFSLIGRIDRAPYDWKTFKAAKTSWGLVGFGNVDNQSNTGISPVSTASVGRDARHAAGGVQALYSSYIKKDFLTDVRSTLSIDDRRANPNTSMPSGIVQLQTQQENGDSLFSTVAFGGAGTSGSHSRSLTWETKGSTEFFWAGSATHYLRVTGDARIDSYTSSGAENSLGSFFYNSLDDLKTNHPSEFSRVLFSPDQRGSEWTGFTAISDSWRITPTLRVLYGARLEGNRFVDRPTLNNQVVQAFDVRNDNVPNSAHVSPRAGFTWRLSDRGGGYGVGPLGQFYFDTPRYLRGGIGEFRNALPANLISDALVKTGLADGSLRISCVGPAVPLPDWSAYTSEAAIPRECAADSPSSSVFTDASRHVELFAPGFSPERSWRANLGYASKYGIFAYTIDANYTLGLSLPDYQNLNFSGASRFLTDDGRNVFVSRSSIDPFTGSVSPVESRRNAAFGSVIARGSTGRSSTGQATINIIPALTEFRYVLRGSYTFTSSRATFSGFTEPSFGSPVVRESSRSDFDARHQFLLQAGAVFHGFTYTMFTRVQSGFPFTPVVSGDVNGDGIANDKAFVYDPRSIIGAATAGQMTSMLSAAPARIKQCIDRQLGHVAGRNSCNGPWTASMNAQITSERDLPFVGQRGRIALAFSNPLGGIDRLLHGPNGLRGWGSPSLPDPNLYYVRGFDPAESKFIYEVNPGFGRQRPAQASLRSPFRVTLDITLDIGKPLPVQQLERWLGPGRNGRKGPKLTATDLKKRYERSVYDPYRELIDASDSLLLSRDQAEAIEAEHTRYRAGMDSIWLAAANTLASLPDEFDSKAALKIQEDATDAAWEYTRQSVKASLKRLLSPIQITLAPGAVRMFYLAEKPLHIRMFMN